MTNEQKLSLLDALCPLLAGAEIETDQQYLKFYRQRQQVAARLDHGDLYEDDSRALPGLREVLEKAELSLADALRRYEHRMGDAGRKGSWIPTMSGRRLFIQDPRPEEIDPFDVAYGLARIPRFNGMTTGWDTYTVAQHSVIGSYVVDEEFALHFLLHDAHEFVGMDVTSPLKRALGATYDNIEGPLKKAVAARFDIEWTHDALVECKRVDNLLLVAEVESQTPWRVVSGSLPAAHTGLTIEALPGAVAFLRYVDRLNDLFGEDLVVVPDEAREEIANVYGG